MVKLPHSLWRLNYKRFLFPILDENLETVLLIDEDLAEGGDILKSLSDGLWFAKKAKGQGKMLQT